MGKFIVLSTSIVCEPNGQTGRSTLRPLFLRLFHTLLDVAELRCVQTPAAYRQNSSPKGAVRELIK